MTPIRNLYSPIPLEKDLEVFETLLQHDQFRLERIVSDGHATAEGQWFDQSCDEWVILLRGSAALRIEGQPGSIILSAGDFLLIPAGQKHRVEWTSRVEKTYWLALHYQESPVPESTGSCPDAG